MVVDIASGRTEVIPVSQPTESPRVMDFSGNDIYLASYLQSGVWLVDRARKTEQSLGNLKVVLAIYRGNAWIARTTQPGGTIYGDTIVVHNLTTGAETVWFQRSKITVGLLGLTADGLPVVEVLLANGQEELWLVAAPGAETKMHAGSQIFGWPPVSDSHGIWLASEAGIYLFTSKDGLRLVSATHGLPAGSCA